VEFDPAGFDGEQMAKSFSGMKSAPAGELDGKVVSPSMN
jgi:hypothetical protein